MTSGALRQWLLDERAHRHLTQKQFATLIGVSQPTVSKIEDLSESYEFSVDTVASVGARLGYSTLSDFVAHIEREEPKQSLNAAPEPTDTTGVPSSPKADVDVRSAVSVTGAIVDLEILIAGAVETLVRALDRGFTSVAASRGAAASARPRAAHHRNRRRDRPRKAG
jgi:transcriptional regulator with XRE-family HTH domain